MVDILSHGSPSLYGHWSCFHLFFSPKTVLFLFFLCSIFIFSYFICLFTILVWKAERKRQLSFLCWLTWQMPTAATYNQFFHFNNLLLSLLQIGSSFVAVRLSASVYVCVCVCPFVFLQWILFSSSLFIFLLSCSLCWRCCEKVIIIDTQIDKSCFFGWVSLALFSWNTRLLSGLSFSWGVHLMFVWRVRILNQSC